MSNIWSDAFLTVTDDVGGEVDDGDGESWGKG